MTHRPPPRPRPEPKPVRPSPEAGLPLRIEGWPSLEDWPTHDIVLLGVVLGILLGILPVLVAVL